MNGYLPNAVSLPSQEHWHFLTGVPNEEGYVIFRHETGESFLIFQQDYENNVTKEIEIPVKELKDLAIWILRGLK